MTPRFLACFERSNEAMFEFFCCCSYYWLVGLGLGTVYSTSSEVCNTKYYEYYYRCNDDVGCLFTVVVLFLSF